MGRKISKIETRPVTVLVTGGSRGIGAAVSLAPASAGFNVAVNYLSSRERAEKVVREAGSKGVRAMAIQGDVSDPVAVARVVSLVAETLGPVGILVNNAGMAVRREIKETTEADFDQAIRQNLKSCFLMTRAVLPGMRDAGWARIIMISSTAAQTGGGVGLHDAASKAGQLGMMHFYATRLGNEGITVNAIAPGLVDTDMLQVLGNPDLSRSPLAPGGDARRDRRSRFAAGGQRIYDQPDAQYKRRPPSVRLTDASSDPNMLIKLKNHAGSEQEKTNTGPIGQHPQTIHQRIHTQDHRSSGGGQDGGDPL